MHKLEASGNGGRSFFTLPLILVKLQTIPKRLLILADFLEKQRILQGIFVKISESCYKLSSLLNLLSSDQILHAFI